MEVYTGYGDKGMTDLSHTKNVSKSDDRICLMGSVADESYWACAGSG